MFLRAKIRKKDGKRHRYFSVVESKRVAGGRVVQKHVLHLGEINDSQELAWRRSIEVLDDKAGGPRTLALFPEDRCEGMTLDASIVRLKLSQLRLCRPRQWGQAEPPFGDDDKRRFGYSRDRRPDCVQVVIALVVTPEGLPLAYEVLSGNTSDKTTLRDFLARIERQYGKARRVWLMDRGIPTEETLAEMREADPPVQYLVGTPKGRLSRLERDLAGKPWRDARSDVQVKLLPIDGELYVLAQSLDRVAKERAMRRRQLKGLWARLKDLHRMSAHLSRDELLIKLGQAKAKWPTGWRLVDVEVDPKLAAFRYALDRNKLRRARRREGRYLLRSNLTESDPATLWSYYLQLVQVEEAFRTLKGDLAIRPIHHQEPWRIEAHIFIAFLAYCLHVTLGRRLKALAPGLTPRSVFEKFAAVQMIDVHIPTADGRELQLTRYTQPEPELMLLLERLRLDLPDQPPPKITAAEAARAITV